jgi:hypothetical protein
MPLENQVSFSRLKVLFEGLLVAGGVLAPTLSLGDPSIERAVVAGIAGLGASWWVNRATEAASGKERQLLPEA